MLSRSTSLIDTSELAPPEGALLVPRSLPQGGGSGNHVRDPERAHSANRLHKLDAGIKTARLMLVSSKPLLRHSGRMRLDGVVPDWVRRLRGSCASFACPFSIWMVMGMACGGASAQAQWPSAQAHDAEQDQSIFLAGPYSFSDELGGFTIRSVSGTGTRKDPVVIVEDLYSATPVTLVIRTTRPIRPFDNTGDYANGILHMRLEARNAGGQGWVEFEFELQ